MSGFLLLLSLALACFLCPTHGTAVYRSRVLVSGNYSVTSMDAIVSVNTTSEVSYIFLPEASTCEGRFIIISDDSGNSETNNINIVAVEGDDIMGGGSTWSIGLNRYTVQFWSNGDNFWYSVSG